MKNDFIDIVKREYAQDDYGVTRKTETVVADIPCQVTSATASEWFEGGRMGLNPDYTFVIKRLDYDGEETVIYNGIRYAVYRTYIRGDDIELHTQKEKGA